jgi:hypothetical protein
MGIWERIYPLKANEFAPTDEIKAYEPLEKMRKQ